jgi:hypothetical protein
MTGLLVAGLAQAAWKKSIDTPCWRLVSPAGTARWLEIHDLESGNKTGLFHVQVLERSAGSQPWQFRSLADHLALTESALRTSIVSKSSETSVYPETFNYAFKDWAAKLASGDAPICKSTVSECL